MGSFFSSSPKKEEVVEDTEKIQVNQWDGTAVKNALDDAAKQVAGDVFKFRETFHLMNVRLAISLVAVCFALFALVYDFLNPFPKSKVVLATCSISYFIMMGIFTLFTLLKERNIVYEGEDSECVVGMPARLEFSTSLKKYSNLFTIGMKMSNANNNQKETEIEFPVERFFTEDGVLLKDKFEALLVEQFAKVSDLRKEETGNKKSN